MKFVQLLSTFIVFGALTSCVKKASVEVDDSGVLKETNKSPNRPALDFTGVDEITGNVGVALTASPLSLIDNGFVVNQCQATPSLPAWASLNSATCVISGTPTAVLAKTTYTIVATNAYGSSDGVTISLEISASVPSISYAGATGTSVIVDNALSVTPTTLKANGASITNCQATPALPAWATLDANTCEISGTPNAVMSATSYSIVATNSVGDSVSASVTLEATPDVPTLSFSGVSGRGAENVAISLTPSTLQSHGAAITNCQATPALPGWATLNTSTCVITGTPIGTMSVTTYSIVATNSEGNSTAATVDIEIQKCPGNYIYVPGDANHGTADFCVMKYGAKAWKDDNGDGNTSEEEIVDGNGGADASIYKPGSSMYGKPWTSIFQSTLWNECDSLNTESSRADRDADLNGDGTFAAFSNPEWMTIAHNIEQQAANWVNGSSGERCLKRGVNAQVHKCGGTDSAYNGTTVFDETRQDNGLAQYVLSNGEIIWDLAGLVNEYVDWDMSNSFAVIDAGMKPYVSSDGTQTSLYRDLELLDSAISDFDIVPAIMFMPLDNTLTHDDNYIGEYQANDDFTITAAAMRGGSGYHTGLYDLDLQFEYGWANNSVGFRCVYRFDPPEAPTISYAGATGTVGTVGVAMSVTPTTLSSTGGYITNCSASPALPAWATLNPRTCEISGTPSGTLGATSYDITATNPIGDSVAASVTLQVN